jgi:hypothetical protein
MKEKPLLGRTRQLGSLLAELKRLRSELRETLRAYSAGLEISLAETINEITAIKQGKKIAPEQFRQIRDLVQTLRERRLKPEKGRRKDLRKIDELISDSKEIFAKRPS